MSPALFLLAAMPVAAPTATSDLRLPPGFTAELYADHPLAPDIYTMTIDDAGRVLVAGRGYVRVLVEDGQGRAARAVDLIDGLKDGPMGLLAESDTLNVVADGGLKRYRGYNGRDKLKAPETLLAIKTGGEHDAHAVRRGPDGWLYLLCGNAAGARKEVIRGDRSPVTEPVAGALLRISPDGKTVEVVADGFRNPYSFDFNLDGEPFTYDSDNERCVGLPWYEGCRFYHVVPGGSYGWRSPQLSQTWRKPPYFPDVVPPVCDTGRGSPTGVACYRHSHFPEPYRGGFFLADWTFGRIYHVPLKAAGSSYSGRFETFAEATGTSGFAPTALAVHPRTGELFVSIGGRGTRGGVYRIRYDRGDPDAKPLGMAKRSLDFDKQRANQLLTDCRSDDVRTRRTALELLVRWWDEVDRGSKSADAVSPNLSHADPFVRRLAGRLVRLWSVELDPGAGPQAKLTLAMEQAGTKPDDALKTALNVLRTPSARPDQRLEATRVVQLVFGDLTAKDADGTVWEGYTLRNPKGRRPSPELLSALQSVMGATDPNLDREVARTLAALGGCKGTVTALSTQLTTESRAKDDIHYLAALGRIGAEEWSTTDLRLVTRALLALHASSVRDGDNRDRFWAVRVTEIAAALGRVAPELGATLVRSPDFGRPEHVLYVKALQLDPRAAAQRFLDAAAKDKDYHWNPQTIELLGALPPARVRDLLRELWDRPGLEGSVVRVLAAEPAADDHSKFVAGLRSLDPEVVRICAHALTQLPITARTDVCVHAVKALRRYSDEKPHAAVRAGLVALLQKYSGEPLGVDAKAWATWVVKHDPRAEKALNASDGFDPIAWGTRAAGIDWAKGDAERGRLAFTKATCAACHDGGGAIGPSLLGVSKRFGRDDLLAAILQPSKDVSARYRPTRVVTSEERAYTGIIVYEATDGIILQTGADTTVRIAGADIASKKQLDVSLMPTGLIDKLTDAEIADLLAYLATLGEPKTK